VGAGAGAGAGIGIKAILSEQLGGGLNLGVGAKAKAQAGTKAGTSFGDTKGGQGSPADWPYIKGLKGQFVPWGKHIPRFKGTTYFVATGVQECRVCRRLIDAAFDFGRNYPDLCGGEQPEYMPMCLSQMKVLQACPEFVNNWCYQDFGGSQVLKSPCPDPFTCHYCLGVNPLHCIDSIEDARESKKIGV